VVLDPDNQTPDGLFYYSEKHRLIGAQFLHKMVWSQVYQIAGKFWEFFTQAANKYADQVCNTFVTDDSSSPDEIPGVNQPWSNPGSANVISPDNLLAWNGPGPYNGVLGYSEPLIYCPSIKTIVPAYKWVQVTKYGKLTGHVYLNGQPQEHVTVQIPGTGKEAGTDKNGSYSFDHVPYGPCLVKAQFPWTSGLVVDGMKTGEPKVIVGQKLVNVDEVEIEVPDIKLNPPNQPYIRKIAITGYASLDCSEWDWGSHHYTLYPQIQDWVNIGFINKKYTWTTTLVSKDAVAVVTAWFTENLDESVELCVQVALDEPGGATNNFPAMDKEPPINIPAGKSATVVIGNSNFWLNGRNGYYYNGVPDLEVKNDTLCCSITFTNNEWSG